MQTCVENAKTNRILPTSIQQNRNESQPLANIIALLKNAREVERNRKLPADLDRRHK